MRPLLNGGTLGRPRPPAPCLASDERERSSVPSFPLVGTAIPRLYLAEGVAAAIEVKSDISSQWDEAITTATSVSSLQTTSGAPVPFFIVGYRGWKTMDTLERNACAAG